MRALPTTAFLVSTCGYTSKTIVIRASSSFATRASSLPELRRHLSFATRAPPSPELRRHLSFAIKAPPSPEFYLSPELRRHRSFTTRDPSFSEIHLRQSLVVTGASRSELHLHGDSSPPVVTRASRSELHLRQSSTFHLSFTSVFCDYFIRCLSHSSHYQRRGNLFFWPLPPAPASSPPSTPTIWELFYRLLQPCTDGPAANHYQRRGTLFLATTANSGVTAPSVSTSWDIFRRLLQPPRR